MGCCLKLGEVKVGEVNRQEGNHVLWFCRSFEASCDKTHSSDMSQVVIHLLYMVKVKHCICLCVHVSTSTRDSDVCFHKLLSVTVISVILQVCEWEDVHGGCGRCFGGS